MAYTYDRIHLLNKVRHSFYIIARNIAVYVIIHCVYFLLFTLRRDGGTGGGGTCIQASVFWNRQDGIYFPGSCERSLPLRRALEYDLDYYATRLRPRGKLELQVRRGARCASPSLLRKQLHTRRNATRNCCVQSSSKIERNISFQIEPLTMCSLYLVFTVSVKIKSRLNAFPRFKWRNHNMIIWQTMLW